MLSESGRESLLTRGSTICFSLSNAVTAWGSIGFLSLRWSIALATLLIGLAAVPLYMMSAKEQAPVEDQGPSP